MVLSLPPIPPELKAITPYLQRADELATKDPVIAYWCAYYAAQQGITLRVKDATARHFLLELLGLLERMKTDLGSNDAVHDESASAAYVENFALRVFAAADNEDRKGSATRNTARKFLAAANFLELLRTFESDKAGIDLQSVEEKIKYAKWKAADISKALREGRKPTPGPAAAESPALPEVDLPEPSAVPPATPPPTSSQLPSTPSPPAIARSIPPPPQLTNLTPNEPSNHLSPGPHLPDGLAPPQPPQSPGSWSTVATPGSPNFRIDDPSISATTSPMGSATRTAFVSDELEGKTDAEIDAETSSPTSAAKSVHFSSSVVGGLSTPGEGPAGGAQGNDPFFVRVVVNSPPASPHGTVPQISPSASASPSSSPHPLPPHAPPARPPPPSVPAAPAPSTRTFVPGQEPATATVTTRPAELTPQVVARVQKHCRYAISALDYEDADQAIKELRTALRMLGG
ncbi:Vta1 like-domain-containing protein [Trametes punicea]|nr:Vta1 like-domain-containing protein [Trametes punicea]